MYRCWLVYAKSWRIIVLPLMIWLCNITCAVLFDYWLIIDLNDPSQLFTPRTRRVVDVFFCCTFINNIYATCMFSPMYVPLGIEMICLDRCHLLPNSACCQKERIVVSLCLIPYFCRVRNSLRFNNLNATSNILRCGWQKSSRDSGGGSRALHVFSTPICR